MMVPGAGRLAHDAMPRRAEKRGLGASALLLAVLLYMSAGAAATDADALRSFQSSADVGGQLNWTRTGNPCNSSETWDGVYCERGRVYKLFLTGLNLTGPITALTALDQLRVLSAGQNDLDGSIPELDNWRFLRQLYLDGNSLSGTIPDSIGNLSYLWRIFVSDNQLTGPIPASLGRIGRLLTLNLRNNQLSGDIPDLGLGNLTDLDVSGNQLTGPIPPSLQRFSNLSFVGNAGLCGAPLPDCPLPPPSQQPSSSSSPAADMSGTARKKSSRLSTGAIIGIVLADILVVALLTLVFLFFYWRKYRYPPMEKVGKQRRESGEKGEFSSSQYSLQLPEAERSKLVFFQGLDSTFELEDLLRASAEMLGKGTFGTSYKAVLEDGTVVAVKRLKDVTTSGKKEFEQQMELVGRLRHPNIVPLVAFYYAKDEKLLVYPYQSNGSLYALLHGSRGPGRTPLDWVTRLRIALGAARGLAYLHQECSGHKIPHANIKSSNVLLDLHYNACVSDFGISLLVTPSVVASRMAGYKAPEHSDSKRVSQRADVYSFGVLLLELLTGKAPSQSYQQDDGIDLPRWVQSVVREEWTAEVFDIELMRYKNIEEEMVALLQIAMLCVSQAPDQRPKMTQVARMIEEIRGDQSPGHEGSISSQSISSPAVSEDAVTQN